MTEKDTPALQRQEGGSHYKNMAIQPVEYILKNGIGFAEGCVIKYVSRWKAKGGVEDLKKARHFLDLLIEGEAAGPLDARVAKVPGVEWPTPGDADARIVAAIGKLADPVDSRIAERKIDLDRPLGKVEFEGGSVESDLTVREFIRQVWEVENRRAPLEEGAPVDDLKPGKPSHSRYFHIYARDADYFGVPSDSWWYGGELVAGTRVASLDRDELCQAPEYPPSGTRVWAAHFTPEMGWSLALQHNPATLGLRWWGTA